jgi:signal transduction histidine kinase
MYNGVIPEDADRLYDLGAHQRVTRLPWILFLSVLALVPSLASALWEPDPGMRWVTGAQAAWVTRDVILLLGAAIIYLAWRQTESSTLGWYAATLTAMALHFLTFDLLAVTDESGSRDLAPDSNPDLVVLVALPFLVLLAVRATPVPERLNPLALGVGVAMVTGALRLVQLYDGEQIRRVHVEHPWLFVGAMATIGAATCVLLANAWSLPQWARRYSALAGILLLGSHLALVVVPGDGVQAVLAAISIVGAMTVTVSAVHMCLDTMLTVQASSALLSDRVVLAEQAVLHDREVMHELRSTVAGVNKASILLRRADTVLPRNHRSQLQTMLEHELSRMERLLDDRPIRQLRPVDLDELIEPLVVAQRALGFEVHWEPSGVKAMGAPDDISEAVHILLTNAARHAALSPAVVTATYEPTGAVAVRVADGGPGIDGDIVAHLFERGVHARSSPGEGIGLHVARRLVRDQGGDLYVESSSPGEGSTFRLVLRSLDQEESAS